MLSLYPRKTKAYVYETLLYGFSYTPKTEKNLSSKLVNKLSHIHKWNTTQQETEITYIHSIMGDSNILGWAKMPDTKAFIFIFLLGKGERRGIDYQGIWRKLLGLWKFFISWFGWWLHECIPMSTYMCVLKMGTYYWIKLHFI